MSEIRQIQLDGINYDLVVTEDEVAATRAEQAAQQATQQATYAGNYAVQAEDAADRAEQIVGGQFVSYGGNQGLSDTQKERARTNINAADNDTAVQVVTQTFTSAQQEIARANIAAGGTNPNLLDNPWFTVNQRSAATIPVGGYGVDRWKGGSAGAVTVASGGLQFVGRGNAYQIPPSDFWDSMMGKTVTASLLFSDGTVQGGSGVIGSGVTEFGTYNGVRIYKSSSNNFNLESDSDANCIVRAVKLELGSVSTLANDTPPDYGTELAKCQRYFIRIAPTAYTTLWSGVCINATTFAFNITTPVPMRYATPTITFTGTLDFVEQTTSGGAIRTVTGLTAYAPVSNSNNIRVLATTASTLGSNNLACIYTYAYTPVIDVSCDL